MGTLSSIAHELFTEPKFGQLLKDLSQDSALSEDERVNVKLSLKDYERKKKYPNAFVEDLSRTTSDAFGIWHEARSKNDFKAYQTILEKIVKLKCEETKLVGYDAHPYEALLEDYEPGLTVKKIDEVFGDVKNELFPFVKKIIAQKKPRVDFISRSYPKDKQWNFSKKILEKMGYDFQSGRADDAAHPFCTTFGPGDVRITIRHDENYFNMMFFAAVHEAGHALYEMGLPMKEQYGLPMGSALSLAFHESQSRFWENSIMRSKEFWQGHFGELQVKFGESLKDVDADEFYRAVNFVEPSFIRVEADELTYHAHIYIRYLIEKALIDGQIQVKDVPAFWNEKYNEYLGIKPANDGEGCLQDVHWAGGAIGYFPTYSLGSFYAAQLYQTMRKDIPGFNQKVKDGEFRPVLEWLRKNIHSTGRKYTSNELLKRATGEELQFKHFMNYAKEKYGSLYGV